jgi:hypothetical protein
VLAHADGFGAFAGARVVAAKQVEDVRLLQLERLVCLALVINQQREGDAGLFAEMARIADVAKTDSYQFRAPLAELLLVLAQLRDMLAAEDSAIVAQERDHGGRVDPQRAEPNRLSVHVRQCDLRQPVAVAVSHGAILGAADLSVKTEPPFSCARLPGLS